MRNPTLIVLVGLLVVGLGCATPPPSPEDELYTLFDEAWDYQLKEFPTRATSVGIHDYNDRLPSISLEDIERRNQYWREANRPRELDERRCECIGCNRPLPESSRTDAKYCGTACRQAAYRERV